jgi:ribonuclease HI
VNRAHAKYAEHHRKYTRTISQTAARQAPEDIAALFALNENERQSVFQRLKDQAKQPLDNATKRRNSSMRGIETHLRQQTHNIQEAFRKRILRRQAKLAELAEQEQQRRQAVLTEQAETALREEQRRQRQNAAEQQRLLRKQIRDDKRRALKERKQQHSRTHGFLPNYRAALVEEGEPGLDLAKIGPVWLTPGEADKVMAIQGSPVDQTQQRVISTDGSLIKSGQNTVAMAFGVGDRSQPDVRTVQGRTNGYASSAKAELMGLFAAVMSAPAEQDIEIQLDNQSIVQQYQQLVKRREYTLPRKRQRSNFAGLWAALHKVVQERPGTVEVKWVRGHATDAGNIMADMVATSAARAETTSWSVDLGMQQDINKFAHCQNTMCEIDLRQQLKQQTTIRRHQAWTAQRRTKRALGHIDDIEWRSTLSIIHNKRPVHTFFSSAQDTRDRTHRVKKLHGMLPTLNVMRARRPDLYPDDICCVCDIQGEDNGHLWRCSANDQFDEDIIEEALSKIGDWGRRETTQYNKDAQELYNKGRLNGRTNINAPQAVVWQSPERETHVRGLSSVGGTRSLLLGKGYYDRAIDLRWTITDLYRGIMPTSLLEEWTPLFATPFKVARTVAVRRTRKPPTRGRAEIGRTDMGTTDMWTGAHVESSPRITSMGYALGPQWIRTVPMAH